MPLKYDDDFDTTAVIIDNSWSKKRKQKEIDNFSKYAVQRAQLEEAVGEYVQTPPAGTVESKETACGKVTGIVPHVKIGHAVGEGYCLQPSIWHAIHHTCTRITAVPFRKYRGYLKDPEYIELVHKRVIGMIQ
jgi:endoglucanase Acf2